MVDSQLENAYGHMVDSKQVCGKDELVSNIEEIFVMRLGYAQCSNRQMWTDLWLLWRSQMAE